MAFHISCPLTCRRICDCKLGFTAGALEKNSFLEEISRVQQFLRDPWTVQHGTAAKAAATVQILVPRVVPQVQTQVIVDDGGGVPCNDVSVATVAAAATVPSSVQAKRVVLQRQALAASTAAEDYVRRLEAGGAVDVPGEGTGNYIREEQGSSAAKVICRICFSGENEGSEHARRMLSCKQCNKKYHRSCLNIWAENRDLFHWNSWVCASCRLCEQCSRTGDPTKLMFCKRCDAAYHCYCQQPPHKNVTNGPFLCPNHARCHSCGSTVPGNGLSTRWFLGYTCCDACGRLFVKGNYCPVCLKVYRDSESTPMVCCDVCQQWVHCVCDGISDEKYQQFQRDGNLYYKCAACRGDCHQVKDIDDAIRELWRRRDKVDRDLIIRMRITAGLPTQEDIISVSPFSDDDECEPVILKNDHARSLKFALKGLNTKSSNAKEYSKNVIKSLSPKKKSLKKGYLATLTFRTDETNKKFDNHDAAPLESGLMVQKTDYAESYGIDGYHNFSKIKKGANVDSYIYCQPTSNHNTANEPATSNSQKVSKFKIKGSRSQTLHVKDDSVRNTDKSEGTKGTKLVIHLGSKNNRNSTSSPNSEASSCRKDQDSATYTGKGNTDLGLEAEDKTEMTQKNDEYPPRKRAADRAGHVELEAQDEPEAKSLQNFTDDLKPLLKVKFKNPYFEQKSAWASHGTEEKNSAKGQRSKRKRPSSTEKVGPLDDESYVQQYQDNPIDDAIDANWILLKLGKDAIGKRVEVHQPSHNSWSQGVVNDVLDDQDSLLVRLDDGKFRTLDLAKQRIRFISQKHKRRKQ